MERCQEFWETFEEIECARKSNLKFGEIAGLEELLGDDGLFEEYGVGMKQC
jgi:hypothetical protein